MTVEELGSDDIEVMFNTMQAVLFSLLRAHGVTVEEITIKEFDVKELVEDGAGAAPRPICCTIDQNGNVVCQPCV